MFLVAPATLIAVPYFTDENGKPLIFIFTVALMTLMAVIYRLSVGPQIPYEVSEWRTPFKVIQAYPNILVAIIFFAWGFWVVFGGFTLKTLIICLGLNVAIRVILVFLTRKN